jgi:PIN domain nuclease of toxin-antitoxin system
MLPEHHKDPVDRIIIATALDYQAQLLSADQRFPDYLELADLLVRV